MTFNDILADIRKKAFSGHDKIGRFERLMRGQEHAADAHDSPLRANTLHEPTP